MAFYNGSNATLNSVAGAGPALNTADMLTRLRAFMVANGWTATNVTAIGGGLANVILSSAGVGSDENINLRMQQGAVSNSLSPLNTAVAANRARFTAGPFFDAGAQILYNEVGATTTGCEIPTDDANPYNFWAFTDSPQPGFMHLVTQVAGSYYSIFVGRLTRQVYNQLAKTSQAISVTTPGTAQALTITLDRPRPTSWVQGTVLFIQSQSVADNTSNGAGVTTQILPVEMVTVGSLTSLAANQVSLTVSRKYAAGAVLGQDVLPLAVIRDVAGMGESIPLSYDNGGGVNALGYTAPNGQISTLSVAQMNGVDISVVLADQGPDSYQGNQGIIPIFTFNNTAGRRFAFRHQIPNFGRIPTTNNNLDELLLPSGDRWLAFTLATYRSAIGKEN